MGTSSVDLSTALQSGGRQACEICSMWAFSQEGGDGPGTKGEKRKQRPSKLQASPLIIQGLYARQYLYERQKQRGPPETKHITRLEPGFSCVHTAVCSLTSYLATPSHKTLQQTTNPLEKEKIM